MTAAPEDRAAFRRLADAYFAALAGRDLDAAAALWDTSSPNFRFQKDWLKAALVSHPSIRARVLEVTPEPGAEGRAVVRALVETNAYAPASSAGAEAETLVRTLELVRAGAGWKVWDEAAGERELALSLLDADDAGRERLLAENPEASRRRLAGVVVDHSLRLFMRSEFKRALEASVYARRLAEAAGDEAGAGRASLYAGLLQVTLGQFAPASDSLELSRRVHERRGDRPMLARALNGLGMFHYTQGQYEPALVRYREALAVAEAAGDLRSQADAERGLGIVHSLTGDNDRALAHYERSLALFGKNGDDLYSAHVLFQVSIIKRTQGDLDAALAADLRCKALYEAAGHRQGLSNALSNLGVVHFMRGDYEGALAHYHKSLAISEEIGTRQGVAAMLHNIALVYKNQGNYPLALEHFQRSLKLMLELKDQTRVAILLTNVGNVQLHMGDLGAAEQSYLKSIAIAEPAGLKYQLSHALSNLGHLYYRQGRFAEAAERLRRSLALHQATGERPEVARTLAQLALVEIESGDREAARADAERAAALAAEADMPQLTWQVALARGDLSRRLGDEGGARRAYEQAIAAVEGMRRQVGGDELQQALFFEDKTRPYAALVEMAAARGEAGAALAYAERTKARALLDVIRHGRRRHTAGMTEEERRRERGLTLAVAAAGARLAGERSRPQADGGKRASELEGALRAARLEYEAFETALYATHPSLKVARGEADPLRPEELAALIHGDGDALVEYVVAREKTFLVVATRAGASVETSLYTLAAGQKELAERAERFRASLARRGLDFGRAAGELYDLLLRPAEKQLRGKTSIVVVPDGPLWELPFQALRPSPGRFLLEDAAVSYAPSLTVLRELRHRGPRLSAAGRPALLAFGDPADEARGAGAPTLPVNLGGELGRLPEAVRQVRGLARLYGAASRVYVGPEAREDRAKAEAGRYALIQFATHGVLDDASPMYSHLVLAPGPGGGDGRLEAWEMMNLDLRADLVVLSACETARGRVGAGEGVIGMSWALFVAGAPAAVVSQWKVDSASTTALMLDFHKNLKAGGGAGPAKAEALRRASLSLMRTREFRHPFYWAGFIVVGDAR